MHRRSLVSNRAIAGELALVLAGFAAGCDDAASPVHIVDVDDGTYLRGVQVSKLEIEPGHEVVRSELYLDRLRVAADELAPFELAWDTRSFGDGAHTLVARIYLASGSYLDGSTAMWIDNTAPQLGAIPSTAMRGTSFAIPATDNLKLARVEISRGVEGEAPVVVANDPFTFSWPWACGTTAIHVRAFDAAGGEVTADASVLSADPDDRDCDGYRAQASGGNDCDDDNFAAHPGATEVPEGYDLDCDGQVAALPGVDFDHDGVPSITDGGNDCNDSDPAIHGPNYDFKHVPITRDGVSVAWNRGDAVPGYGESPELYLNSGGVIERYQVTSSSDAPMLRTQLATGANAGSIAQYNDLLAFGSGHQLVLLTRPGDAWVPRDTISAAGTVGKLALGSNVSTMYIAYQVGTELWFALLSGTGWNVERVATLAGPIESISSVYASQGAVSITVQRTSQSRWSFSRGAAGDPFTTFEEFNVSVSVTLYASASGQTRPVSIGVRDDGSGSAIYNESSSLLLLRSARRIAALVGLDDRSMLVTYLDGQAPAQVVTINPTATKAHVGQELPNMSNIEVEPSSYGHVFAGPGMLHYLASRVLPVDDAEGDGVDRDCDKLD